MKYLKQIKLLDESNVFIDIAILSVSIYTSIMYIRSSLNFSGYVIVNGILKALLVGVVLRLLYLIYKSIVNGELGVIVRHPRYLLFKQEIRRLDDKLVELDNVLVKLVQDDVDRCYELKLPITEVNKRTALLLYCMKDLVVVCNWLNEIRKVMIEKLKVDYNEEEYLAIIEKNGTLLR